MGLFLKAAASKNLVPVLPKQGCKLDSSRQDGGSGCALTNITRKDGDFENRFPEGASDRNAPTGDSLPEKGLFPCKITLLHNSQSNRTIHPTAKGYLNRLRLPSGRSKST